MDAHLAQAFAAWEWDRSVLCMVVFLNWELPETLLLKDICPRASAVWILLTEEGWVVRIRAEGGLLWSPLVSCNGGCVLFLLREVGSLGFAPFKTESTPE